MRALIVVAVSVAGLVAGAAPVRAADLPVESSGHEACCDAVYGTAATLVIYDDEPGVIIRRWWLPPWRNRHYYPHGGGKLMDSGPRHTDRSPPRRPRSYARYWTNPPVYVRDPDLLLHDDTPLPRPNPYRYLPSVVVVPTAR